LEKLAYFAGPMFPNLYFWCGPGGF